MPRMPDTGVTGVGSAAAGGWVSYGRAARGEAGCAVFSTAGGSWVVVVIRKKSLRGWPPAFSGHAGESAWRRLGNARVRGQGIPGTSTRAPMPWKLLYVSARTLSQVDGA